MVVPFCSIDGGLFVQLSVCRKCLLPRIALGPGSRVGYRVRVQTSKGSRKTGDGKVRSEGVAKKLRLEPASRARPSSMPVLGMPSNCGRPPKSSCW